VTVRKCILIVAILSCARAQTPANFEVASIRPNHSGGLNTRIDTPDGGRLVVTNASLKTLIRNAFGILSFQLAGGPGWLDTDMYDIEAKTGDAGRITQERLKLLLQSLLADRFALRYHRETRELPVYALAIGKGGSRLKRNTSGQRPSMNTSRLTDRARMIGTGVPMAELASNLGNQLGRIVVDDTGLDGFFDFTMEWVPDGQPDSLYPSIFTAVQEQLGLKLEARKGPVEVIVIDSAEKASAN